MNADKITELREQVKEAIVRLMQKYPRMRAEVAFTVPDKFGEDTEEHVLVFSKKGGQFWVRVDDEEPAETVSTRVLIAIPEALAALQREIEKRGDEVERAVDVAIEKAKKVGA